MKLVGTTAARVGPSASSVDLAEETLTDKGREYEVDVEEEGKSRPAPLKRGLSRSESMSKAANKAVEHYKEHKWKYIALKVAIALAIGLGVGLGIAYAVYKSKNKSTARDAILAGKMGTQVPTISAIPAKDKTSSSRRLVAEISSIGDSYNLRRLSTVVTDPANFDLLSDYMVYPATKLVVQDASLEPVDFVNIISCFTSQMRGFGVGLNTTFNPKGLPYAVLLDTNACTNGNGPPNTAYVQAKGPNAGGDGEYTTEFMFMIGGGLLHGESVNTISNNALTTSKVYIDLGGGYMQIGMSIDFSNPSMMDVQLVVDQTGEGPHNIHAKFNPTTYAGSLVSQVPSSGSNSDSFQVQTDGQVIKRKKTTSGGSSTTVCLDYSADKMIFASDQYTLFDAADGSLAKQIQGFPATYTLPAPYSQYSVDVYLSYWGAWANDVIVDGQVPTVNSNTLNYTFVTSLIQDQDPVVVLLEDGSEESLKLTKVNARLMKYQLKTVKLGDVKGLPLQLDDNTIVQWDGSKFVKVGYTAYRCMLYHSNDPNSPIQTVSSVDSYLQDLDTAKSACDCIDMSGSVPYGLKSDKSDPNPQSNGIDGVPYTDQYTKKLTGDLPEYAIDGSSFKYGMNVRTVSRSSAYGKVDLVFDQVQKLYFWPAVSFTAGQVVTQPSTGATGVVYKSAVTSITVPAATAVTFTANTVGSWSLSVKWNPRYVVEITVSSGGEVYLGLEYTSSAGVTYTVEEQLSGTTNGAGTYLLTTNDNGGAPTLTGQDTFSGSYYLKYKSTGKEFNKCYTPSSALYATSIISAGALVVQANSNARGYVAENTYGLKVNVISGTFTDTDVLSFSTGKISPTSYSNRGWYDVTGTITPTAVSSEDWTFQVKVTSSVKFSSGNRPVLLADVSLSDWVWVNSETGDAAPITSDTTLSFQTYEIVQAGTAVPELSCYGNCPVGQVSTSAAVAQNSDQPKVLQGVSVQAVCTVCPTATSVAFSSTFKTDPVLAVTCDATSGQISVAITSRGIADPTKSQTATPTLSSTGSCGNYCSAYGNDGMCTSVSGTAAFDLNMATYADDADLNLALKYSFDDVAGSLTDKSNSKSVVSSNAGYFGPFFEASTANKAELACPWDPTIACPWMAWQVSACFRCPSSVSQAC